MGKYENDKALVERILAKEEITHLDRLALLKVYGVSYHDSGKIEELYSCDSSCHNCTFCQRMMEAAKDNKDIICGYCYDAAQENRWWNVRNRHGLNLRIMSSVEFTVEELATLKIMGNCRINSSGEIENVTHARNMVRIGWAFPQYRVAVWSKNVAAMEAALKELGKPANMIFIQSSPFIGRAVPMSPFADYEFIVVREEDVEVWLKDGHCECNGKKCRDCGYKCYYGTWPKGSYIIEKLRLKT